MKMMDHGTSLLKNTYDYKVMGRSADLFLGINTQFIHKKSSRLTSFLFPFHPYLVSECRLFSRFKSSGINLGIHYLMAIIIKGKVAIIKFNRWSKLMDLNHSDLTFPCQTRYILVNEKSHWLS